MRLCDATFAIPSAIQYMQFNPAEGNVWVIPNFFLANLSNIQYKNTENYD